MEDAVVVEMISELSGCAHFYKSTVSDVFDYICYKKDITGAEKDSIRENVIERVNQFFKSLEQKRILGGLTGETLS